MQVFGESFVLRNKFLFPSLSPLSANAESVQSDVRFSKFSTSNRSNWKLKSINKKGTSIRPIGHSGTNINIKPDSSCFRCNLIRKIRVAASALIITTAAALLVEKCYILPARAEPPAATVEEKIDEHEESVETILSQFLESHGETVEQVRALLRHKVENNGHAEALSIVKRLVIAQPKEIEWKIFLAKLLNEMKTLEESRQVYEEILTLEPFHFDCLLELALLMDRIGDGDAAIGRLENAVEAANMQGRVNESRRVKLIIAQVKFLQNKPDEALRYCDELTVEEPEDFRPYFYRGVIYTLTGRHKEATREFAEVHKLCPGKINLQGFQMSPLSRMDFSYHVVTEETEEP